MILNEILKSEHCLFGTVWISDLQWLVMSEWGPMSAWKSSDREYCEKCEGTKFFSVIVDEATDESLVEQMSLCMRYLIIYLYWRNG